MKVGVVTTSRADFGIYYPLLKALDKDPFFELSLFALGMHVSKIFGNTMAEVKKDFPKVIVGKDTLVHGDSADGISKNMAATGVEFATMYAKNPQDIFICLGDRYEMISCVLPLVPYGVPLVHIHGGEQTEGAIDNKFRHALTELCDYHFVTCEKHAVRVRQMGLPADRVLNVGSLSLAALQDFNFYTAGEMKENFGIDFSRPVAMVSFNPISNDLESNAEYLEEFLAALSELDEDLVITLGNADTGGEVYRNQIKKFKSKNSKVYVFDSLGKRGYFSAMKLAKYMIGNSSSGVIEAASFNLPVVNVGDRQKGRESSANVVHSGNSKAEILAAVKKAKLLCGKKFENIYFKKDAAEVMVQFLKKTKLKTNFAFVDQR